MSLLESHDPSNRKLSKAAVWVGGVLLSLALGPFFPVGIAFIYFGLKKVGGADRAFDKMNYGRRKLQGFGIVYFLSLGLCMGVGFLFTALSGAVFVPMIALALPALVVALLVCVCTFGIEYTVKWINDEFIARYFGPQYSNVTLDQAHEEAMEQDWRWANRNRQTGQLAPPQELAPSMAYHPSEPPYKDFTPPLSWGVFCTICGARNEATMSRCWYCDEYGRQYHDHLKCPDLIHPKHNEYRHCPSSDEPQYKNGHAPLQWTHKCTLCGARCPNSHEQCWYCHEKGRLWGLHWAFKCPFVLPQRPQLNPPQSASGGRFQRGDDRPFVPTKPRR